MTTKEQVIKVASKEHGGFVDTDGEWCLTRTPLQFKNYLENTLGFVVTKVTSTAEITALADTAEGIRIAWNGYCRKIK